jgi:hypothetical protein
MEMQDECRSPPARRLRPSSDDFPRLSLREAVCSTPRILSSRERILDETTLETTTRALWDPVTGRHAVHTMELVQKTIETEVDATTGQALTGRTITIFFSLIYSKYGFCRPFAARTQTNTHNLFSSIVVHTHLDFFPFVYVMSTSTLSIATRTPLLFLW